MRVAKTKALISFAVTAKLICVFVFAYAKSRSSHDAAHINQGSNSACQRQTNRGQPPASSFSTNLQTLILSQNFTRVEKLPVLQ